MNEALLNESDEDLLRLCRGGDEAAWERLISRYQRLIYTVPRRAGLDEDTAAEVFQEVFMTLYEKLATIEQPERLHAWLVTTARRKTWRMITRDRPLKSLGAEADNDVATLLDKLPDDAPLADKALLQLEREHLVRAAMLALDERCQQLLTLLFYTDEPPPYADIARLIHAPEGSIGPTRARCLEKLLRQLKDKL